MFYGHFCAHGRLNGPNDLQRQCSDVQDETLQICPRRDSNSGGSHLWSNALPTRPRRRPIAILVYLRATLMYLTKGYLKIRNTGLINSVIKPQTNLIIEWHISNSNTVNVIWFAVTIIYMIFFYLQTRLCTFGCTCIHNNCEFCSPRGCYIPPGIRYEQAL